jgi:hypothetical protein
MSKELAHVNLTMSSTFLKIQHRYNRDKSIREDTTMSTKRNRSLKTGTFLFAVFLYLEQTFPTLSYAEEFSTQTVYTTVKLHNELPFPVDKT